MMNTSFLNCLDASRMDYVRNSKFHKFCDWALFLLKIPYLQTNDGLIFKIKHFPYLKTSITNNFRFFYSNFDEIRNLLVRVLGFVYHMPITIYPIMKTFFAIWTALPKGNHLFTLDYFTNWGWLISFVCKLGFYFGLKYGDRICSKK